jgi:hypothetical protein
MDQKDEVKPRFQIEQLEERIAPTQSHYPPGQFPSGPPGQHPGNGNAPGNSWKPGSN